jgi:YVTN family beta-propeller protein
MRLRATAAALMALVPLLGTTATYAAHNDPEVIATIPVGGDPRWVAVNAATNRIYVTDRVNKLVVIDGATNAVTANVTVGAGPSGVAVNPVTNRIYVMNTSDDTLSVVDGATNTVVANIPVGGHVVGVNPATNRIYVANVDTVTVIDGATHSVIATIPVAPIAHIGIAVNPITNRIYVSNTFNTTITVIDGATNTVSTTIDVGGSPGYIDVNPVTNRIYVATVFPTIDRDLVVVDGTTETVITTVDLVGPSGVAVNVVTNHIYVADESLNYVDVINGATNTIVATVILGPSCCGRSLGNAVNPVTDRVYQTEHSNIAVIADGGPAPDLGRMTGGGSVFDSGGTRVTHGFELHCEPLLPPNNLQVNWGRGNKFQLESLTDAHCSDDPDITSGDPLTAFDTHEGEGTGRYNGQPGAEATWRFTDAGEPGTNDLVELEITFGGTSVLDVSGTLEEGNHQAHAI